MDPTILQMVLDAFLLVAFVACIGLLFFAVSGDDPAPPKVKRTLVTAVILLFVGLVMSLSVIIVPAGNIGVITAFGKVDPETLPPGLHFRVPFVNQNHLINTRVQPHEFKEIDAASSEYQQVKLTGIMNYHVDGQFAADLYQRVGDDFAAKILDPAFNDYIKTVVPQYAVGEILAKRDEIRQKAKADLQANLSQYHVIVDDIYLANIAFSDAYSAAIEAKQVAQQQVETEKQILAQRQIQAQQAVVAAKGQADANVETATGQSKANDLLTKSLTPELIQYTLITKLAPTIQTLLLPSGQNFILDPNALLKPSPAP